MKNLAPGFLIAMPQLGDPNFQRSVVLIIEHNDEGAMGLVLNRAAALTLRELARGQKIELSAHRLGDPVFVGGPVEPYRGFVLHNSDAITESTEVIPGLFLSVTSDSLEPLLASEDVRLRFCLGYAGWGPKQLEKELSEGSWLFTEAELEPSLEGSGETLWSQVLNGIGVDPARIVAGRGVH